MSMNDMDFTLQELMVVASSREIKDGEKVIVGTGLPLLGAMLAQKTHAPDMIMIYESGTIEARPLIMPLSVADSRLIPGAAMQGGLIEGLGMVHAGDVDVGFLGGAQVDKYGNLNSHCIGDFDHPSVRFAGSGGANDIASGCKRTVIIIPHLKEKFVEKVDFLTTPGYLTGMDSREKLRFPGKGPAVLVSTLGIFRFHEVTKEMYLESYHPGVTVEKIKENTGWDLKVAGDVRETEHPTAEEIRIVRDLDPTGMFLKKK